MLTLCQFTAEVTQVGVMSKPTGQLCYRIPISNCIQLIVPENLIGHENGVGMVILADGYYDALLKNVEERETRRIEKVD